MSYDPTEPTPLDVIRGLAADTSNDPDSEILQDATYLAILDRFGVASHAGAPVDTAPFYRAAAEALRRVATTLQARPSSISSPGDGTISWSSRTNALVEKAVELDARADALEAAGDGFFGPVITVRSRFLTGSGEGTPW